MEPRIREIDRQLAAGVAVFRGAAWVWLAAVAAASTRVMDRVWLASALVAVSGVVTAWLWRAAATTDRSRSMRRAATLVDLVAAAMLLVGDGWVYGAGRPQSLAGAWPVATVLSVAIVSGRRAATLVALALGGARFVGQLGTSGAPSGWPGGTWLSVLSTTVLFALAGLAAAEVARRVRQAEDLAADVAARERVARDLHDGMLQTLAAVQRRAADPNLVALARAQEAELRSYLFSPSDAGARAPGSAAVVDVGVVLRRAVSEAARRFGLQVDVALVPPLPTLPAEVAASLGGAVGECLANVAKHAGCERANLFAEVRDGCLEVVVRDRGVGFVVDAVVRRGLSASVDARMAELGGEVEVRSTPGRGTEVRLRLVASAGELT